jgi:hypothetical protein
MDNSVGSFSPLRKRSRCFCLTSQFVNLHCVFGRRCIYLVGSAPKVGLSTKGLRSIGAPLFHRPTIRAPRRSLPFSGVKDFPFPSLARGFSFKKTLNSGTVWKRYRKTRKLPSTAQGALGITVGSPVCPVTITPGCTGLGPGLITVSKPVTTGLEIPSKKPKLGPG